MMYERMMEVTFRHIALKMAGLLRPASILLLSALTALAVLSCGGSDDDATPEPPLPQPKADTPIVFSGSLSEDKSESHARTRATIAPLSDTHQTFYVWGYKNLNATTTENVMQSYTVNYVSGSAGTTTSNSSGWEYVNQQPSGGTEQSIKYWDFTATDYRFFGYAGSTESSSAPRFSCSLGSNSVSISFDASVASNPQQDPVALPLTANTPLYSKLWYKTGAAIASDISPVTLEFLQPYVKVRFMFRQSESAETVFTLTDKRFRPTPPTGSGTQKEIATAGTFTVTYPMSGAMTTENWSVSPVTATLKNVTEGEYEYQGFTQDYYEAASNATDEVKAGEKMWYVVLPAVDQGSYTLSVKVNNDPRTVVVPAQYMDWQPGYEYTYIFKITDPGGVELEGVKAGFNPWTVYTGVRDIYNW